MFPNSPSRGFINREFKLSFYNKEEFGGFFRLGSVERWFQAQNSAQAEGAGPQGAAGHSQQHRAEGSRRALGASSTWGLRHRRSSSL